MNTICEDMIELIMKNTMDKGIKNGLKITLEILRNSGYYNLVDWENMTEKEKIEELQDYIKQ